MRSRLDQSLRSSAEGRGGETHCSPGVTVEGDMGVCSPSLAPEKGSKIVSVGPSRTWDAGIEGGVGTESDVRVISDTDGCGGGLARMASATGAGGADLPNTCAMMASWGVKRIPSGRSGAGSWVTASRLVGTPDVLRDPASFSVL